MKRLTLVLLLFYFDMISSWARNTPKHPIVCKEKIELKLQLPTELKNIKIQFRNKYKKVEFNYYPMMVIDKDPIKCIGTDKWDVYKFAKDCTYMSNCNSFMILKDDIIFNVCYSSTKSEEDLIDGEFMLDELLGGTNPDDSYYISQFGKNVCLGAYLIDKISII